MALPDGWVDYVFSKLTVRYGAKWLGQWEGVPLQAVRVDWSQVLDGLQARDGAALLYGLQYLPDDFPPTATEFRKLCNRCPDPTPQLPAPEVDRDKAAQVVAKLREIRDAPKQPPRALWDRLKARLDNGERLPLLEREMVEEALRKLPPIEQSAF
jgi:hypothetical protein